MGSLRTAKRYTINSHSTDDISMALVRNYSTLNEELEIDGGSSMKPRKFLFLNDSSTKLFDHGKALANGHVSSSKETKKRPRKVLSPSTVDVDGSVEPSFPRLADSSCYSCAQTVQVSKDAKPILLPSVKPVEFCRFSTENLPVSKDVKPILIPGVKRIDEFLDFGPAFVRPLNYIRQYYYNEVDVAFSTRRIIYDMDSEDEEWLNQQNGEVDDNGTRSREEVREDTLKIVIDKLEVDDNGTRSREEVREDTLKMVIDKLEVDDNGTRSREEIREDTLEMVIDKLEKTCFIEHREAMPVELAVELCQDLGSHKVIKAIHSYWSEKRQRKGMSLVRYFQPAPCEQYEKQLKERDIKINQLLQRSPTATRRQLQHQVKKPALLAFCNLPNGLKTQKKRQKRPNNLKPRNQMQKQRYRRKVGHAEVALRLAAEAKDKREAAISLRSRAQALQEVADAARQKAVAARIAAVVAADAIQGCRDGQEQTRWES